MFLHVLKYVKVMIKECFFLFFWFIYLLILSCLITNICTKQIKCRKIETYAITNISKSIKNMKEKKKSKKNGCISTQAVAHFDWHFVGLLRLGLETVKSRLSIGPWQGRGPVLRLGKGSSKLYPSTGSSH